MHRIRRFWWIACAGLAAVGCQPNAPAGGQQSGPPAVSVSKPVQRQVMNYEDLTGQTEAVEMVDVRARVTGYLNSVEFVDGSEVREGDLLFQIDARPYQDQLDQAVAQVKANQESYRLAQTIYASDNSAGSAVPRQQVAQDYASMLEADARTKASIASTEVNKLNMEFTRVTAPISGQISRTYVTRGNLITQDSTPLTTIVKPDPMYAYYELDEPTLLRIRRDIIEGRSPVPGQGMTPVYFGLQGEDGWPHQGVVDFFNNQINPATGTISVRGVFANPLPSGDLPRLGGTLLGMGDSAFGSGPLQALAVPASRRLRAGFRLMSPGMFVRIHLPVGQPHDALLVSDRAISSDQGLKYIYVVDSDNKLKYLRVAAGALQEDGLREILPAADTQDRLQPDDRVVVGTLQQLGRRMEVKPDLVPMPTLGPGAGDDQGAGDGGKEKKGAAPKDGKAGGTK